MLIKYSNQTDRAGEPIERRTYYDNGQLLEKHRKDSSGEWKLYEKVKQPLLRKRKKVLNWSQNDNPNAIKLRKRMNKLQSNIKSKFNNEDKTKEDDEENIDDDYIDEEEDDNNF